MKGKSRIIVAGLAALTCAFGFAACDSGDSTGGSESEYTYDWTYRREFVDECDSDMTIDGVLDEERWQNVHWLYHGEDEVKLSYTTIFTEKGCYIGAIAEDKKMQWNGRFNFSHWGGNSSLNSAFWFQIAGPDVADGHAMREFNFFVDAFNKASRNQTRFAAASTTDGDILEKQATKMTAEVFISWDALNVELGENGELPEFVYLTPSYRYVVENTSSCVDNRWIYPLGTYPMNTIYWREDGYKNTLADFNYYRAKTGVHFNKDGYINYDTETAKIGMSANGISKSDGWDLSDLEANGRVSCVSPYEQFIFVKDVYAEKYHLKADLIIDDYADGNPGNEWPSIGLATVISGSNSRCFYIDGTNVLAGKTENGCYTTACASIDLSTWKKQSYGKVSAAEGKDVPSEGFSLELIKDGSIIYYIVEGKLVGTDNVLSLAGKACPALFSIGGRGTYQNVSVETDSDKIDAALHSYVRTVTTKTEGSGTLEPSKYALKMIDGKATDDLTIDIVPDVNYVIENVTIGGLSISEAESWAYFLAHYKDGVFTIEKEQIEGNLEITVKFTRLRSKLSADQVVEVKGFLKTAGGEPLVGSQLIVYDEAFSPLYYTIVTSSTGAYSLLLPKAGTYSIGGHDLPVSGTVSVKVLGSNGYKALNETIDLSQATDGKLVKDFVLERLEFRPTEIASSKYTSKVTYTINGSYEVRGAYYFEEKSVEQGENFVLYATIDPTESSNIASEAGFVVGTGDGTNGNYLFFALKKEGSGFSAYIWTEGGTNVGYNCTSRTFFGERKWMNVAPFGLKSNERLELSLVYKNGEYSFYLNGCLAYTLKETDKMGEGWPAKPYAEVIGTEGDKKLGLFSLNADTAYYDWGFSTDESTISAWENKEGKPVTLPEETLEPTPVATKPNMTELARNSNSPTFNKDAGTLRGVYYFDGNGIKKGTEFVLYAEVVAIQSSVTEIGFIVGTGTAMTDGKYMQFVWNPKGFLYAWNQGEAKQSGGYGWAGGSFQFSSDTMWMRTDPFGEDGTTHLKIALVYKDGIYSLFFNGLLGYSWLEDGKPDYSQVTYKQYIEGDGLVRLGMVSLNGSTTICDWGYTTDESEVDKYVPDDTSLHLSSSGWIYGGGSFTENTDNLAMNNFVGTFRDVSVKKGTSYALKAKIKFTGGAMQAGFVVSSEKGSYMMFVYRHNKPDVYCWKDKTTQNSNVKWSENKLKNAVDVFGENDDRASEFVLVYKNGTYYMFIDGVLVLEHSENDTGGYGTTSLCIGNGEDISFGLASPDTQSVYTDYGYTTDATEIEEYFK